VAGPKVSSDRLRLANREMLSAFAQEHRRHQRRWAYRRPIEMIDRLFDQLEQLQLQDLYKVPVSLRPELARVEIVCELAPGALRTGVRIGTLQDELFELQAVYLASLRDSSADADAEELSGIAATVR
jgi:hypothetical protein